MGLFARRLFLVGTALAALAVLMAPALAGADDDDDDGGTDGGSGGDRAFCAPAGPPDPGQCSYSARFPITFQVDFDAGSGPMGENPTGTLRWRSESGVSFMKRISPACR